MNDFDGQTWVAFCDLCGLKAMYAKEPNQAANALNKFYNVAYDLHHENDTINSLVVSDCAIFWIDRPDCIDDLGIIIRRLKEFHSNMLPDYLLRSTIAYGHFKYQQRLEMPTIRKNMIVGGAYLEAYANNDKIDHGAIVIVKLPEGLNYRSLQISEGHKMLLKANYPSRGLYEYFWSIENSRQIKDFIMNREKANNATFSKLKELYAGS